MDSLVKRLFPVLFVTVLVFSCFGVSVQDVVAQKPGNTPKVEKKDKVERDSLGRVIVGKKKVEEDSATRARREEQYGNDSLHNEMRGLMDKAEYDTNIVLYASPVRYVWADDSITETIDELLPEFEVVNGRYAPKNADFGQEANGIFLYFRQEEDGRLSPLHLRLQYCGNVALGLCEAEFVVDYDKGNLKDEFTYRFTPRNIHRGKSSDNKKHWEMSDDIASGSEVKDLLYAITHCEWTRMTLKGKQRTTTATPLTDEQMQDIYNTMQLYRLMGGVIK